MNNKYDYSNLNYIFHLAIPSKNLDESKKFYSDVMDCKICREYETHITINFFDHQLVCHKTDEAIPETTSMYPRHFGINLPEKIFWNLRKQLSSRIVFWRQPFMRAEGLPHEHWSFFLKDPSENLIEFKTYKDSNMNY